MKCSDLLTHTNWSHINHIFSHYRIPGKLKQFLDDLHSGKLHREFHHGPDETPQPVSDLFKVRYLGVF